MGANVASAIFHRLFSADIAASRISLGEPKRAAWNAFQLTVVAFMATFLAACAQSPVAVNRNVSLTAVQKSVPKNVTAVTQQQSASSRSQRTTSDGLASFYKHESLTASGEKFNPRELTAAHRTLPFGTRVRVTNVATGQSVTVRVNDRGPFINGRVIDVSHSAAESLGMVEQGVAKVKLDIIR